MPPEPDPVEEAVDFGAFNMEKIEEEVSENIAATETSMASEASATDEQATTDTERSAEASAEEPESSASTEVDFSALESQMGATAPGEELADEFSFADTSQSKEEGVEGQAPAAEASEFSLNEDTHEEQTDFDGALSETDEPDGPIEFDFSEDATADQPQPEESGDFDFSAHEPAVQEDIDFASDGLSGTDEIDFSAEEPAGPSEFSFDDNEEAPQQQEQPDEFSFGDSDNSAFSFGDDEESTTSESSEVSEPDGFSFDDENPFGDEPASEWGEENSGESVSFDFEEPQFDTDDMPAQSQATDSGDNGLQFGEISFASDSEGDPAPSFESEDFSKASMATQEEPEDFTPSRESAVPRTDDEDDIPLPVPPPKRSSLSRILALLVLLLVTLGGAAGYLFIQEGTINLNTVVRYLPFLQEYIGEAPASSPVNRIGINIYGSSYVNGKEGQMLVIQGSAVNNHPSTRSAITIKGVLVNAQGQSLLQQTVFCGNKLNDAALKTMSFAAIEEAMNNQFGDSLSNMNVAAGASIPFTIVFRNLPAGIANINIEVVDSKPGAG